MVFPEFQSQKYGVAFGFSMRYERQLKPIFLCMSSQTSRNSNRTKRPSLSKNTLSLFLFPRIEFHKQSRIDTAYNAYLADIPRLGSLRALTIMSTPPFYLNSFLFLLQLMQRFEMIEKHSSLMSSGFSFSFWRNSIKLSMTPSSVILSL